MKTLPHGIPTFAVMLNDLEAFSVYFTEGAADEKVAYPVVGLVFCHWVTLSAPALTELRGKDTAITSGSFPNVVNLYKIWSTRLHAEKTKEQLAEMLIQYQLAQANVVNCPPPIGT